MSDKQPVAQTAAYQEQQPAARPAVDVFEDETGITLLADMPGVPKDQLELKVEGDELTIEGSVESSTPEGLEAVTALARVSCPPVRAARKSSSSVRDTGRLTGRTAGASARTSGSPTAGVRGCARPPRAG